jgi:hypothetical protein
LCAFDLVVITYPSSYIFLFISRRKKCVRENEREGGMQEERYKRKEERRDE